jgi:hypothetical protein
MLCDGCSWDNFMEAYVTYSGTTGYENRVYNNQTNLAKKPKQDHTALIRRYLPYIASMHSMEHFEHSITVPFDVQKNVILSSSSSSPIPPPLTLVIPYMHVQINGRVANQLFYHVYKNELCVAAKKEADKRHMAWKQSHASSVPPPIDLVQATWAPPGSRELLEDNRPIVNGRKVGKAPVNIYALPIDSEFQQSVYRRIRFTLMYWINAFSNRLMDPLKEIDGQSVYGWGAKGTPDEGKPVYRNLYKPQQDVIGSTVQVKRKFVQIRTQRKAPNGMEEKVVDDIVEEQESEQDPEPAPEGEDAVPSSSSSSSSKPKAHDKQKKKEKDAMEVETKKSSSSSRSSKSEKPSKAAKRSKQDGPNASSKKRTCIEID